MLAIFLIIDFVFDMDISSHDLMRWKCMYYKFHVLSNIYFGPVYFIKFYKIYLIYLWFSSVDNLLLNKTLQFYSMVIVVTSFFLEGKKYPQIFLTLIWVVVVVVGEGGRGVILPPLLVFP